MKLNKGDIILKKDSLPIECLIIVSGHVISMLSKRLYTDGSIFGLTDIIYERKRLENFIAESDTSLLMFERTDFEQLLNDFPDIEQEVKTLAEGRDELIQAVLREKRKQEEAIK